MTDFSRRVAVDLRLRPRGRWDRHRNPVPTTVTCKEQNNSEISYSGCLKRGAIIFNFPSERTSNVEEKRANGRDLAWLVYWQRNATHNPPLRHFA